VRRFSYPVKVYEIQNLDFDTRTEFFFTFWLQNAKSPMPSVPDADPFQLQWQKATFEWNFPDFRGYQTQPQNQPGRRSQCHNWVKILIPLDWID
jgi:hypothetical protein